ncbi:MAG: methyltransferase [Cloacibacillus sp.]
MTACHDLLYGVLKIIQPEEGRGLRVNMDTILLAHFTRPRRGERILEIGCAHGAVSLILAKRGFAVEGIDIQPHLIELAVENAKLNGLDAKFRTADIRCYKQIAEAQSFDRIVVNPPYDEAARSRPSPKEAQAAAMHGACCALSDIIEASHYLLKNRGRLDIVMREDRIGELFELLGRAKTPPKIMRCVHPKPHERASVVLVEAMRSGRHGIVIEPPLFITGEDGEETPELKEAYVIKEDAQCRS